MSSRVNHADPRAILARVGVVAGVQPDSLLHGVHVAAEIVVAPRDLQVGRDHRDATAPAGPARYALDLEHDEHHPPLEALHENGVHVATLEGRAGWDETTPDQTSTKEPKK